MSNKHLNLSRETSAFPKTASHEPASTHQAFHPLLRLQRTIGNQAVLRLLRSGALQTKLRIGKSGDVYEQEADRVAQQVMRMPELGRTESGGETHKPVHAKPIAHQITPFVQRQVEPEEEKEEEEEIQTKKVTEHISPLVQSQVEEEEEKEEEQLQTKPISEQVIPLLQRQEEEEEEEKPIQAKSYHEHISPLIQRQPEEEEEETGQAKLLSTEHPTLQRQGEKEEEEKQKEKTVQTQSSPEQPSSFLQKQEEVGEEEEPAQTKLLSVEHPVLQRQEEENKEEEETLQTKGESSLSSRANPGFESQVNSLRGTGQALPESTKSFMEPRFGYDFSSVRIHKDSRADSLSKAINAKAFTLKRDVVFKSGHYVPDTAVGRQLLAHELTHVVQQNPGIARKRIEQRANINEKDHSPVVRGWSIWGGIKSLAKRAVGAIKKAGKWLLKKAKAFVAKGVRLLPGYELVTVLWGKDPITGEKTSTKSGGFLRFIFKLLGKEKIYDNLVKAKIVEKIVRLFKTSFSKANLTWKFIIGSIKKIISVLSINPETWSKAVTMTKNFLVSLIKKVFAVGKSILMKLPLLILKGFLILVGAPVKTIMRILSRGKNVIMKIAGNPIKFIGNLFRAMKKGFFQFKENIWGHLKAGLMGWLMGTLEGAGIQLPKKWDLKGIFSLIMQILGLTYDRIRAKIVKVIGEKWMKRLEKGFEYVKILSTQGVGALWEKIKEDMSSIKDAIISGIKDWVVTKIVVAAITKLATMFNPVGAVIQAALAIYNTIMFLIERAKQIAAVVSAVFSSIAEIAHGKISKAANWIEKTMARTIPVILSFLARLLGLGGISKKIQNIIAKLRKPVDEAVDRAVAWIVKKARSLFKKGKALTETGISKIKEIFFPKKKFTIGKETHTVEAIKSGKEHKISISSSKAYRVKEFIEYAKKEGKSVSSIDGMLNNLNSAYDVWSKMPVSTQAAREKKGEKYFDIIELVESIWRKLPNLDNIPVSKIRWKALSQGRATGVIADPLTIKGIKGGPPTEPIPGWYSKTVKDATTIKPLINISRIRAHLLHHDLHGPGRGFNLTPTSHRFNRYQMFPTAEKPALEALGIRGNKTITTQLIYETKVTYDDSQPPPLKYVAKRVKVTSKDKISGDSVSSFDEENYTSNEASEIKKIIKEK